jgi:mono/diheme cytochrome c family protein
MATFLKTKETKERPEISILACVAMVAIVALTYPAARGARAQSSAQANGKSDASVSGNVENGKKLYRSDGCFECHGTEGQGAAEVTGPRIGPPQLSFEGFTAQLRHPSGQMPPYTGKVVSDRDLADLYAYLQSRPKAAQAKDIPLLNQ